MDTVKVDLKVDNETLEKLNKMTKKELIERICIAAIKEKVADNDLKKAANKAENLQTRLNKAEAYIEQGRAMIDAIMERWYEYDT